jgi:hypothetical protein
VDTRYLAAGRREIDGQKAVSSETISSGDIVGHDPHAIGGSVRTTASADPHLDAD